MALSRVNNNLQRPAGRCMAELPKPIQVFLNDIVDQFIDYGAEVNRLIETLERLITQVQQGTRYNIFIKSIYDSGVTQVEITEGSGDPIYFDPGHTLVFVDKRCQTPGVDFTETADEMGNYRYVTFFDPLPYDLEENPPGPEIVIVYIKKVSE